MLIQQQGPTLPLKQGCIIFSSIEALKLFSDHFTNWVGRSKNKSHILSLGTPIKSDSQHQPLPFCLPQAIWLPDKICTNNKSINQATAGGKGWAFFPSLHQYRHFNGDLLCIYFYGSPKESTKVFFVLTLQPCRLEPQFQYILVEGNPNMLKCKKIQVHGEVSQANKGSSFIASVRGI